MYVTVIELLFLSVTVDALQGKTCQNSLLFGGVGQVKPTFQGKGSSGDYFLVFTKLDTFCYLLSDSANCNVLRVVVLTQYRLVTDRQTDRIAAASTGLAMRALRRAVKMHNRSTFTQRVHYCHLSITHKTNIPLI